MQVQAHLSNPFQWTPDKVTAKEYHNFMTLDIVQRDDFSTDAIILYFNTTAAHLDHTLEMLHAMQESLQEIEVFLIGHKEGLVNTNESGS